MGVNKRIRAIRSRGYVVTKTNGQHLRITRDGMPGVVFAPSTPSDSRRGDLQMDKDLRRMFGRDTP